MSLAVDDREGVLGGEYVYVAILQGGQVAVKRETDELADVVGKQSVDFPLSIGEDGVCGVHGFHPGYPEVG